MKNRRRQKRTAKAPAVYIETSLLDPLPATLSHAELERIVALAKQTERPVIVTRLSIQEFTEHKKRRLHEIIGKARQLTGGEIAIRLPSAGEPTTDELNILESLETQILEAARDRGIQILETGIVNLKRLIEMAVKHVAPFSGAGDKGFKDAVILFTIADDIKASLLKDGPLVLSNDDGFIRGIAELPEMQGLQIETVRTFRDAIAKLEQFQTAQAQRIQKRWIEGLRKFLMAQKEGIAQFILNAKPAFALLRIDDARAQEILDLDMARSISSVNLSEIKDPVLGDMPSDAKEGRVNISFIAKVSVLSTPYGYEGQGEVGPWRIGYQWLDISGSVSFRRKKSSLEYSDLKLEGVSLARR
jgi:hypothetical protein